MEKQRDFKVISGFILKVIALIFMTIDHLGVVMLSIQKTQEIAIIFRILGRLAFPLFIFLLVEGVKHTRHFGKYFLRLSILAGVFLIGQLSFYFLLGKNTDLHSPIIDLLLTSLCVYLLKKNNKLSFLAILPFGWAVLSLVVRNYEITHATHLSWMPFFLRPDYALYGPVIGIGFYYGNTLAKIFLKSKDETKDFIGTSYEQTATNVINAVLLVILTVSYVFLDKNALYTYYTIPWQIYSLFAFIPLLFYSGKRGYNAKWFKYGCYIYFPTHFIIVFAFFLLLLVLL